MASIDTFSIWLPDAQTQLRAASGSLSGLQAFEAHLAAQLPACERLIRWAMIRVENNRLLCEGAYYYNN